MLYLFRSKVEGKTTPIWNVMGVIPGHIRDEIVLVGNHRDGKYQTCNKS